MLIGAVDFRWWFGRVNIVSMSMLCMVACSDKAETPAAAAPEHTRHTMEQKLEQKLEKKLEHKNNSVTNSKSQQPVLQRDVAGLMQYLSLPFQPIEAVWFEQRLGNPDNEIPGPTDSRLDAVLLFTPERSLQLQKIATEGTSSLKQANVAYQPWYPQGLMQHYSEESTLLQGKWYRFYLFFRTPYTQGRLIHIKNTHYFRVELFAF